MKKADPNKLRTLIDLRDQHQITQAHMAALFDVKEADTVRAWEQGDAIPPEKMRRERFISYLLDDLCLRRKPNQFRVVWDILIEQWQWQDLTGEEKQRYALAMPPNPYRGLKSFTEVDDAYFFGREAFTAKLQQAVKQHPLTVLVGPSGSGKSSVIQAGLIPTLKQDNDFTIVKARPGTRPFHALCRSLIIMAYPPSEHFAQESEQFRHKQADKIAEQWQAGDLTLPQVIREHFRQRTAAHLLIIIDQFEELLAPGFDEHLREYFLENLITLIEEPGLSTSLLLAIRVDYLEEAMASPTLSPRLQDHLCFLPRMTEAELEAAILKPAHALYIDFEEGLLNRILLDISQVQEKLTLLEFALEQLWTHPENKFGRLTKTAYQAIGRVPGALSQHAESVFEDLEEEEQVLAPRLFVQLVKPGKQGKATRYPATRSELGHAKWSLAQTLAAEARLVVIRANTPQPEQVENGHEPSAVYLDEPEVEIVHEALIDEWKQLRTWIDEAYDFRSWQEDLKVLVRQWEEMDGNEGTLLRGTPLAVAEDWLVRRSDDLSPAEGNFINISKELREREVRERTAQQERELEQAHQLAESERRRGHIFRIAAVVAIFLTAIAVFFAVSSNRNATIANVESIRAVANEGTAVANADLAATNEVEAVTARETAEAEAIERATAEANAVVEAERANAAQATAEVEQARAEHEAAIARSRELAARSAQMLGQNYELALLLALEAGQSAPTFEADTAIRQALYHRGRTLSLVTGHDAAVWHLAWDPTGDRFATAGDDGTARIWNVASGGELLILTGHQAPVWHVAWNTSGNRLLTASDDGTARVWDTASGRELLILTGHQAAIGFAAWNPDGTHIITVSDDFTARIWNAENGQLQSLLRGHTGQVVHAAWSLDGTQVVTAGWDSTARLWDADTGELLAVLADHTLPIRHVAWDPAGTRIVTASNDGSALIWDTGSAEVLVRLAGPDFFGAPHEAIWYADWNSNGRRIVTASSDGRAEVWDAQTGARLTTLAGHTDSWVIQAAWSPDNSTILTASWDGTARIWDGQTGVELIRLAAHTDGLSQTAWHPSGTQVATASRDGTARVWELSPGSESPVLAGHLFGNLYSVRHAAWDMSGTRLVTASEDDTATVWRVTDGTILTQLKGHEGWVLETTWNKDNSQILTASYDGTARIWNAATGVVNVLLEGHTGPVYHAAWNFDETRVATASADGTARIWDANSGEVLVILAGHQAGVNDVIWETSGSQIASASTDRTARIWDAQTGNTIVILSGHEDAVNAVQWNWAGTQIATASDDGTARIWDSKSGEEMSVLTGHTSNVTGITWHPSGSRLLTYSWDETARVWGAQTGEELLVLSGHTGSVTQATWSPDGSRIVTVSSDNSARIWDGNSGELLAILSGHSEGFRFTSIHHVAWSPDGNRVATAASDGTVRVHYVAMTDLITAVCQHTVRNMSLIEWQSLMGRATPYHKTCSE